MFPNTIYIRSRVSGNIVTVESDDELKNMIICDAAGEPGAAALLSYGAKNGKFTAVFDASELKQWTPETPVLYTFKADGVCENFGYCELSSLGNSDILLNGRRIYLRGYIRGITAHEHPNMTGNSNYEAAVKNIRQAKKYGFNLVRFHSTIPDEDFVRAADEEGLFIHMEIGFAYEYDEKGNKTSLAMDNKNWQETILKYRNHPSVAIFCIGNEMHNSGHQPGVYRLYETGRQLAPGKLIMDNSGWGEYDRPTADIFAQHIAYYFPYKHHREMFNSDDCWRLNGSAYDCPLDEKHDYNEVAVNIRRQAVPLRPVLAHEAMHYIDIPDYAALNKKFDNFCASVGEEFLKTHNIKKPRYLTELPELIERKGLSEKLPDYIAGSQEFKKMAIKTYLEALRDSALCGYEMLQLADCLKYENKNGILDFFDDDKFFDPAWMRNINDDAVLLASFEDECFCYDSPVKMVLKISNFLDEPRIIGDIRIAVDGEVVYTGKNVALAGGLQTVANIEFNFKSQSVSKKVCVSADFDSAEVHLHNSWPLWIYPHVKIDTIGKVEVQNRELLNWLNKFSAPVNSGCVICDRLDDQIFTHLNNGKHVILLYHRDNPGQKYYFPGALERFKPCIWDRGSNLGGVVAENYLQRVLASDRYFDKNMQPLLEGGYKICLDDFPVPVREHIFGIDKPVRDRMKGLIHGVKDFIATDTLRNFSHLFTVKAGQGVLTVCTMLQPGKWIDSPVTENFFAELFSNPENFKAEQEISLEALKEYLEKSTAAGVRREDVMNHFWEIDNKPVEDTLFWEEVRVDMRKLD